MLYGRPASELTPLVDKLHLEPFRDVSEGPSLYKCTISDCLKALEYAIKLGWYNYKNFDVEKWEKYEQQ